MSSHISNRLRGFTLIELMVTVGIFVFMTALILARYNSYYSGTLFANLAYDVALSIRQAQSYGMSVKVSSEASSDFSASYGIVFNSNPANANMFTLGSYNIQFDGDNGEYNYVINKTEKVYNIKQGAKIQSMCVRTNNNCDPVTRLLIIFQRPNPEAIICGDTVNLANCIGKFARITLVASDGSTRTIEVNGNGQISVPLPS